MKPPDQPPPSTPTNPHANPENAGLFKLMALIWLIIGCIQLGFGNLQFSATWLGLAVSFYFLGRQAEKKSPPGE